MPTPSAVSPRSGSYVGRSLAEAAWFERQSELHAERAALRAAVIAELLPRLSSGLIEVTGRAEEAMRTVLWNGSDFYEAALRELLEVFDDERSEAVVALAKFYARADAALGRFPG